MRQGATADEYTDVIGQKTVWSEEVNSANAEIAYLNNEIPDEEHKVEEPNFE